jgi:transcriptional regulator with XRE-family HTH domain
MDGEELRRRRDALGMSQEQLADALGVYQTTITRWETGGREIRHPRILALALDALALRMGAGRFDPNAARSAPEQDGDHEIRGETAGH